MKPSENSVEEERVPMIVKNWSFDEFPAYDAPIDGVRELHVT